MFRHSLARAVYGLARDRAPRLRGRRRVGHALSRWLVTCDPLVVSSYGLLFEVDLRDHVEEEIFWEDYDRDTIFWWQRQMTDQTIVFDVGANVGLYSLVAAARGAHAFAFEPNPRTRGRLEANVLRNRLQGRVVVRPEAVSDAIGEATLYDDVNEGRQDANAGVASLSNRNAGGRAIGVKTTTLDGVVREIDPRRLDWIKMDIQGAEYAALSAASETLGRLRPRLLLEVEPGTAANMGWTEADLCELLRRHGYQVRRLDPLNVIAEPE